MKKLYLPLVIGLSLSTSGCFLGRQTKAKVPAPRPSTAPVIPQPAVPSPSEGAAAEAVPVMPTPPAIQAPIQSGESPLPQPGPIPARAPVVKPPAARNPVPQPAAPVSPPPLTPAGPLPQLTEILTADQRRQYQAEYTQDVARSNAVLKQVSGRRLSASQREAVARIRTFLRQAAAALDNDISTAVQLSRRADLLGQELQKGLK